MVDDLEFDEVLPLLSADPLRHDEHTLSRRRFIVGALAAAGVGTVLPAWRAEHAGAATPVGGDEGILVVVFLGGGNDGLNTIVPRAGAARGSYERLRGSLALPAGSLLPLDDGWGMHPALARLHARFTRGRVAVVQGTGLPDPDLSHFTATANVMRGSARAEPSGWLGRYLDGVTEADSGMRGMVVGSAVPLYLLGERAKVTAIPTEGALWGADRSDPTTAALIDSVGALATQPIGLGPWGDEVARTNGQAVTQAQWASALVRDTTGATGAARDLVLAARLLNADLGARVVGVTIDGWDTHLAQLDLHAKLLGQLDQAVDAFFATLAPSLRNRVTMLVQSEFGRRPSPNSALGTDHGTANPVLVLGENVRGGLHAAAPALDRLDDRGNVTPTVDLRTVYASLLDEWLHGDSPQLLGAPFGGLGLFQAAPGQVR